MTFHIFCLARKKPITDLSLDDFVRNTVTHSEDIPFTGSRSCKTISSQQASHARPGSSAKGHEPSLPGNARGEQTLHGEFG